MLSSSSSCAVTPDPLAKLAPSLDEYDEGGTFGSWFGQSANEDFVTSVEWMLTSSVMASDAHEDVEDVERYDERREDRDDCASYTK